jgi:alpha-amylase/alpha-mannosidase (GH57 family)
MTVYRNLAVHAHFYQPPREDPFLNEIREEPGAYPYHDWNEKIFQTCYLPNIELGNFSKISFNIGPTLTSWLYKQHPDALEKIISADRQNVVANGVGNAIAQAYHHTILPLSTNRDKQTEIKWGIADFQKRFARYPEGMWLPETAVDIEILEILAENEIKFTILAPWQAESENIDHRKPYRISLPNGKEIIVFFYDRNLSSRVSFDTKATSNADGFILDNVLAAYRNKPEEQIVLIASDGELYGHHQAFRDKFLSHLLNGSLVSANLIATYPSQYLKHKGVMEKINILENTSWSCHHGIERWRGECDCTGFSDWKRPLRITLDALAAGLDELYFQVSSPLLIDPWKARNEYIHVLLGDRSFEAWLEQHAREELRPERKKIIQNLIRSQVNRLKMFASCGWFFDDFDRIEPKNAVINAAHAVWLSDQIAPNPLLDQTVFGLKKVRSQRTGLTADAVFLDALEQFSLTRDGYF